LEFGLVLATLVFYSKHSRKKSLQYVGSRWRKTLALSEKQKQALEFGKDFAAALSLLLSIGFKCLKKPHVVHRQPGICTLFPAMPRFFQCGGQAQ
jgi:hypothetical protein